jgi:hypothetical protein
MYGNFSSISVLRVCWYVIWCTWPSSTVPQHNLTMSVDNHSANANMRCVYTREYLLTPDLLDVSLLFTFLSYVPHKRFIHVTWDLKFSRLWNWSYG